jgi:V-type H+-transporting ATPase subunit F
MASLAEEGGKLIAVIGDEDTVTGFLLAGVGHRTPESTNFLVVKADTPLAVVEDSFRSLTQV